MKTLTLQFKHDQTLKPRTWKIEYESASGLTLTRRNHYGSTDRETYTRTPEGEFRNEHGVLFVQVKLDRRPKPFILEGQEEGRGPKFVNKFATLQELQTYVKARWLGAEYIDGQAEFHSDYVAYVIHGCTLSDLGTRQEYEWTWKNLKGNEEEGQ